LKELLGSTPSKLEDLFDEIFKHVEDSTSKRQDLLRFSQWIFCSFRPLSLSELLPLSHFKPLRLHRLSAAWNSLKMPVSGWRSAYLMLLGVFSKLSTEKTTLESK